MLCTLSGTVTVFESELSLSVTFMKTGEGRGDFWEYLCSKAMTLMLLIMSWSPKNVRQILAENQIIPCISPSFPY